MDEFTEGFTIANLIIKENIEIKSIHLLSENERLIIAVSWVEDNEAHFKMFKNQEIIDMKTLCGFLLEYNKDWYYLVVNWTATPSMPLHLKVSK